MACRFLSRQRAIVAAPGTRRETSIEKKHPSRRVSVSFFCLLPPRAIGSLSFEISGWEGRSIRGTRQKLRARDDAKENKRRRRKKTTTATSIERKRSPGVLSFSLSIRHPPPPPLITTLGSLSKSSLEGKAGMTNSSSRTPSGEEDEAIVVKVFFSFLRCL